jgi:predicted component of type VI protein secretion system
MGLLEQLKAATANVQSEPKKVAKPQPKAKAATKTDTPKTKGGASYVIPKEFKQAIEDHLKGRADMADKLTKTGKTIDGCCDYIFDVMRKRAEKERKGQSAVGLYADPDEIFGLACHYYDESEEDLKNELKN